jgi:hypothetical protein
MKIRAPGTMFIVVLAAGVGGCGGGGGGGGGGSLIVGEVPFTSFQSIRPNQTAVMSGGISQTASGSYTASGTGITFTSASLGPLDTSSTVKLTYDSFNTLSAISIATPQASVSFSNTGTGNSIDCTSGLCAVSNASTSTAGIVIDGTTATALGWNYQTFGVWEGDVSPGSWQAGAISAGNPTPASAVPTVGLATFTGLSSGFYADPTGTPFITAAGMTANVDFSARSVGFSTSNTQLVNVNTLATTADNGLNLTGTLTYAAGTNQFSGPVNTGVPLSGVPLSGTATGQFYGPNAQEIGGTYGLSDGSGVSHMLGAFGGKR